MSYSWIGWFIIVFLLVAVTALGFSPRLRTALLSLTAVAASYAWVLARRHSRAKVLLGHSDTRVSASSPEAGTSSPSASRGGSSPAVRQSPTVRLRNLPSAQQQTSFLLHTSPVGSHQADEDEGSETSDTRSPESASAIDESERHGSFSQFTLTDLTHEFHE